MMKQIIVPLDFSKESMNGLDLALIISSKTKANIQMVYVSKSSKDFLQISQDEEHRSAKKRFMEIQEEYAHKLPGGVELTYIIKKGKIYDEVVEQAESFDGSLISVSTHGASGFEEFFIGSNALKIITASECPVFAIKYGIVPKSIGRILLPVDYTMDTRQKVPYTLKIAKYFGAKVHVMGVSSGNDPDLMQRIKSWSNQVSDYLQENGIETVVTIRKGEDNPETIIEYARNEKMDLISIMTEQESSFRNFLLGSNAQQMLSKSPVPVLCITSKDLQLGTRFKKYRGIPPA